MVTGMAPQCGCRTPVWFHLWLTPDRVEQARVVDGVKTRVNGNCHLARVILSMAIRIICSKVIEFSNFTQKYQGVYSFFERTKGGMPLELKGLAASCPRGPLTFYNFLIYIMISHSTI